MEVPANRVQPLLLIFPFNQLSHYLRCLMLAKKIKPYCDILFAGSAAYNSFVVQEGFDTFECQSIDPAIAMEGAKNFSFSWLNEKSLALVYEDQVRVIAQYHPTMVLGDAIPTLKMAAEKTDVTYISLFNGYMSKYYAGKRPIPHAFPGYAILKKLPSGLLRFFITIGEAIAFYTIHGPFKKLRRQYRLSVEEQYLDEVEGDVNLICDLPQIFPQKHLPDNYIFIPPLFYDIDSQHTGISKRLDKNKKTIFVSMGSTGDWSKAAFLNRPYFQKYNIVTAGDSENIIHAPSVIKENFVNIHELFPFTDLVVCHGGNGTIYQALSYGIPLLCLPAHFEQEWNVQRIEDLGLGKALNDISDTQHYFSVIEEWIAKKQLPLFQDYRNKIQAAIQSFDDIIATVAERYIK